MTGSWRRQPPIYNLARVHDLLPRVPAVLENAMSKDNLRLINYWADRPEQGDAARMIFSEADRLISRLRDGLNPR